MLEKELRDKFCERLQLKGIKSEKEVHCKFGDADIVTIDSIYEVKRWIDSHSIKQAIGQLFAYRNEINKNAKLYIVGEAKNENYRKFTEYMRLNEIRMFLFEEGKFVEENIFLRIQTLDWLMSLSFDSDGNAIDAKGNIFKKGRKVF